MPSAGAAAPAGDRLLSLDLVRGVAVLGILLLNIVSFAMPDPAYYNPRGFGGWHGADRAAYLINLVLFDGKMRGLFSFLFGASMLLVIDRAGAKGLGAARIHFSRMAWLLLFGLAHLWLVWEGDILSQYAVVGMIAYAARRMRVAAMLALGIVLVMVETLVTASVPAAIALAPGPEALAGLQRSFGVPAAPAIDHQLAIYRGSYAGLVAFRLDQFGAGPIPMLIFYGAETLAYMLFGMAALRTGLLGGRWDRRSLVRGLAIGFGIGIPASLAIAACLVRSEFSLFSVALGVLGLATPVRPLMILGWICLILLLARPGGWLTMRVAAAGRMAFTNYLATSLVCTTLFYGYGLGWFGHLMRAELYGVVVLLWAAMLLWSLPWLRRFRHGPLEWLWRSLARATAGVPPSRKADVIDPTRPA